MVCARRSPSSVLPPPPQRLDCWEWWRRLEPGDLWLCVCVLVVSVVSVVLFVLVVLVVLVVSVVSVVSVMSLTRRLRRMLLVVSVFTSLYNCKPTSKACCSPGQTLGLSSPRAPLGPPSHAVQGPQLLESLQSQTVDASAGDSR